jgi:homoserine kinase
VTTTTAAVTAFGPACIGNLAAGFDVLGAAIAPVDGTVWGDLVSVAPAPETTLTVAGPFAHQLPSAPTENLVWHAWQAFARRLPAPPPGVCLHLHKGLPVGSGLGSSSASVVAALRALAVCFAGELPAVDLLAAAAEAEAHASGAIHLDNVGPALLGGLRLITCDGEARPLRFPAELGFVVTSPELTLSTRAARAVLPDQVPLSTAIAYAQNLAGLVAALDAADLGLLRRSLRDLLVEPHRAPLVPGFGEVQSAALGAGAWGCSLSGSGPAMFAVAPWAALPGIGRAMTEAWAGREVRSVARVCALDREGARIVATPCS